MKRLLITLLSVLLGIPLILGGIAAYTYHNTTEEDMPKLDIQVMDTQLQPAGYDWNQPVLWGILFKEFKSNPSLEANDIGALDAPSLPLSLPNGYTSMVRLEQGGQTVWTGVGEEWNNYVFTSNDRYILEIVLEKASVGKNAYGTFTYRIAFSVDIQPVMESSASAVEQGDVLTIRLSNMTTELMPTAYWDVCDLTFVESGDGVYTVNVPVTHNLEPGDYTVEVRAGAYTWDVQFRAVYHDFPFQDLLIDESSEQISEALSPASLQQYRDRIYPLYTTAASEQYWEGVFMQPTSGRISTEYGTSRITNGDSSTLRTHTGMDYATEEGTEVYAPNSGVVVLAEYLTYVGNTIVIEHGGGLKTYYYHLSEINVQEGDFVSKGELIGAVGSTGYSTGPHLHYEMRIMNQSISPERLYTKESSGFMAFAE